jgi:hypothetical protein
MDSDARLSRRRLLRPLHSDPRWPKLPEKVGLSDALVADLTLDVKLPN